MQLENSKIISDIDSLKSIVEKKQKEGKCVVFTNGCFDILHPGHIFILEQAKSKGDFLVVGLNSDKSVKSFKSDSRPICSQYDRAYVLAGLESVDYIFIFDESTPESIIMKLTPDILVKGKDYNVDDIAGADYMIKKNKKIELVDIIEQKSTTSIIERIKKINP
tara:strand:- start:868 stop:1359 length:492 start_codon:yes stop_codon:yes gene_type:complete